MKRTLTRLWALTCLAFLTSASVWGQSATKATIQIKKNVNGQQETVTEEIVLDEGQTIEDILQELGLLDEFGQLLDGQAFEISIRKTDVSGGTQDIELLFSPTQEMNQEAFLGVYLREAGEDTDGALVTSIIEDTSAEDIGLQEGDVIVKIDDTDISNVQDLVVVIRSKEAGDKVKVHYLRDGKKKKDNVALGNRTPEGIEQLFIRSGEPSRCNPGNISQDCEKIQFFDDNVIFAPFDMGENQFELQLEEGAFLGVSPQMEIDGQTGAGGMVVGRVVEGSSAEDMGLLEGDVITHFNGTPVPDFDTLAELIESSEPGQDLRIEILRDGKKKTANGAMGSREYGNNQNFRIFHDLKGVDEDGNLFYNYDFEFDTDQMERSVEELRLNLQQLGEGLEGLEWIELEGLLHEGGNTEGLVEEVNISINITDITAEEALAINENAEVELRLDQDLELETISFFPNPTLGQINLAFEAPTDEAVTLDILVYDQNGATIYRETRTDFLGSYDGVIDISNEASGTYYLQIVCGEKSFSRKVVKKS